MAEENKKIRIALAGNPNAGKTTLFNSLTGSNQFVGNWPGVTVEKKEGKLKKNDNVIITDLPGIYSLSPYTLEEVVARNYLIGERPDAILNIVDATNLERNLYLTTQLLELGIPVVIALNMMDVVKKEDDHLDSKALAKKLGVRIVEISALKGEHVLEAADEAIKAATKDKTEPLKFAKEIEECLSTIKNNYLQNIDESELRWYSIKLFERDDKVIEELKLPEDVSNKIEEEIVKVETKLDDDSESLITNERYNAISSLLEGCYKKKNAGKLSVSDKIDKVVTNRWLALPIFALIMFIVYFVSVTTVGTWVTDWTNDCLFGDGYHLFGIGTKDYNNLDEPYQENIVYVNGAIDYVIETEGVTVPGYDEAKLNSLKQAIDSEAEGFDLAVAKQALADYLSALPADFKYSFVVYDDETLKDETIEATRANFEEAITLVTSDEYGLVAPDPADFGVWIPGIPVLVEKGLDAIHCWGWLEGLILDGIVAGLGAILGFVPQILVLFIFLALLEMCGYMSRIAFVLDRIFRKFGLSGKSFIPMLIGTGCGVPGIMASRTIENERDRRMTIMTTTFIPCSAKLPFIAMIAGAIFGGAWWVAPSAYFLGMFAIIVSGIMLKKTKLFAGEPAPFVMELPAYRLPTFGGVMHSMWERGWSFIKKAGTIILLSTIVIWFMSYYGWADGHFGLLDESQIGGSILGYIGKGLQWMFVPLGFGTWQATVASFTGFVAKENIVGTLGIVYGGSGTVYSAIREAFTPVAGYSFLIFNLLCAPCFAAIGAMKREMNNPKWTIFAVAYQCLFAYSIALIFNQFGLLFTGQLMAGSTVMDVVNIISLVIAFALIGLIIWMLFRPYKEASKLEQDVKVA